MPAERRPTKTTMSTPAGTPRGRGTARGQTPGRGTPRGRGGSGSPASPPGPVQKPEGKLGSLKPRPTPSGSSSAESPVVVKSEPDSATSSASAAAAAAPKHGVRPKVGPRSRFIERTTFSRVFAE
jgi:hypothetical protein